MKEKAKKVAKLLDISVEEVLAWFKTIDEDDIVGMTPEQLAEMY